MGRNERNENSYEILCKVVDDNGTEKYIVREKYMDFDYGVTDLNDIPKMELEDKIVQGMLLRLVLFRYAKSLLHPGEALIAESKKYINNPRPFDTNIMVIGRLMLNLSKQRTRNNAKQAKQNDGCYCKSALVNKLNALYYEEPPKKLFDIDGLLGYDTLFYILKPKKPIYSFRLYNGTEGTIGTLEIYTKNTNPQLALKYKNVRLEKL